MMDNWRSFLDTIRPDSKFRFAPTPSGYLHLGNGVNFALTWLFAKAMFDCPIMLRIDDIDKARKRPKYVSNIINTLDWLEFDWQEGPKSVEEFENEWSQHLRLDSYAFFLEKLRSAQVLFPCKKSRSELAPFNDGYPAQFRNQATAFDEPQTAWRILGDKARGIDDFVVRKKDGLPAYQIVSIVDDLAFGISHVVRGADLAASTAMQRYAAAQAGGTDFNQLHFYHHPLIHDEAEQKLSKSDGAYALKNHFSKSPTIVYQAALRTLGLAEKELHDSKAFLAYFKSFL